MYTTVQKLCSYMFLKYIYYARQGIIYFIKKKNFKFSNTGKYYYK